MNPLVDAAIRSSAMLVVGLTVTAVLRHRTAALRHLVLAASVFAAAAVVPLSYTLPSWDVSIVRQPVVQSAIVAPQPSDAIPTAMDRRQDPVPSFSFVTSVWGAGFLVTVGLMLIRIVRLARVSARAVPVHDNRWIAVVQRMSAAYGIRRRVTVVQTDTSDLLAVWGFFRPRVLLPAGAREWSDDRVQVVVCHELAHVRRHDWLVQMCADFVRSVYWFNPLFWIVGMCLRRESEHACDDVVLGAGVAAHDYAAHLLELARISRPGRPWAPAMPMARRSTLERRITAMLNAGLSHRALSRRAILVVTPFLVSLALPAAALRAIQNGPLPLAGTIYDSTGAVLPGVDVTLQDAQEFKWQATTDGSGHFEFPPVQPGRYVLDASLAGFKTLRNEFTLKDARDWDRPITLQVGEVTESITVSTARTTSSTRATQAQTTPVRVRVGGNIRAPLKLQNVNPIYPDTMRDAGRAGTVPIEAIIGLDGSVLSVRVLGAAVHPDFAKAAADAVRQWQFSPTLLNGAAVEVVMKVTVSFTLE